MNTRNVCCRRPLMAVTEMTDHGNWVVFGPGRVGFAWHEESKRKIDFDKVPGGWDMTVELEPPQSANKKIRECIDLKRCEHAQLSALQN
eukprot:1202188-Karenia_brevis.AAC.1